MLLFVPLGLFLVLILSCMKLGGLCHPRFNRSSDKVKNFLYWNGTLRILLELYLELLFAAAINVYLYDSKDGKIYPGIYLSNVTAFIVLGICTLLPIFIIFKYWWNAHLWEDKKFKAKWGSVLEGTNTNPCS